MKNPQNDISDLKPVPGMLLQLKSRGDVMLVVAQCRHAIPGWNSCTYALTSKTITWYLGLEEYTGGWEYV
jgi:hypothetical protein